MQSISTSAPLGSAPTWTVARAGGALRKYRPYASLTLAKSAMSATKIVVFTTLSKLAPPASSTAFRFSITRSVCAPTSPCTGLPVAGSIGSCPDTNRNDPGLTPIPWLEESMALGAWALCSTPERVRLPGAATHSIWMRAPCGSAAIWTVARAGEDRFQVLHHALGLRHDVALHHLAGGGVDGDLP